ncbi:MAG: hypothetical protein VYE50_00505, partial [Candidatus Thermoplasmatota archaeon]|nr:hypothetical protein [Candidatus Thermoplasmatota archaeon]
MKQVVFAVFLLAMASLTGCLNEEDSPVDEKSDTTDDSTSDTTEDNTDTTQDDTDTTDDTKDDELIDPVGGNGDTIPEDSSIHIDSNRDGSYAGNWDCDGVDEEYSCEFVYYVNDNFDADDVRYYDSDSFRPSFQFMGWVNKTG